MATWKELIADPRYAKLDDSQREQMLTNWVNDQKQTNLRWAEMPDDEFSTVLSHMRELGSINLTKTHPISEYRAPQRATTEDLTMGLLAPGSSPESEAMPSATPEKESTPFSPTDYPRALTKGAVGVVGSTIKGTGDLYQVLVNSVENVMPEYLNPKVLPWWATPQGILREGGDTIKDVAEFVGPPKERMTLGKEIAEGVGQLGGQIAMYYLSGGTAGSLTLLSQGADQIEERVGKMNIPQANKDTAITAGALVTVLTEKYGVDKLLNRVPPAIKNRVLKSFTDITIAGGIEATQEAVEGFLHNAIVKTVADSRVSLTEGTLHEAFVAGGSAGIVRALLTSIGGKRTRPSRDLQDLNDLTKEAFELQDEAKASGFDVGASAFATDSPVSISESDIRDFIPELKDSPRTIGGGELPVFYGTPPIEGMPVSEDYTAAKEVVRISEEEAEAAWNKSVEVGKTERRVDLDTRARIDAIHLKAKEQGPDSLTDDEIEFLNNTTADRAIANIGKAHENVMDRKERKSAKKEEVKAPVAEVDLSKYTLTEQSRKAVSGLWSKKKAMDKYVSERFGDWVEDFKAMRDDFELRGMSPFEATAEAMEEIERVAENLDDGGVDQIEKSATTKPVQNTPNLPVQGPTTGPLGADNTVIEGQIENDKAIELEPLSSEEEAQVKPLLNEWYQKGSFDNLSPEGQDILRRAGKAPKTLSDTEARAQAGQHIGRTNRNSMKGVTVDFLGLQASYEKVVDAIVDTMQRLKLDWNLGRDDMRNFVINEWLQTPRDLAKAHAELQPIVDAASDREIARSKMEDMFYQRTKPFWDLHEQRRKALGMMLFKGDLEKKIYTEQELEMKGFTASEIHAYLSVRQALDVIKNDLVHSMTEEAKLEIRLAVQEMAKNGAPMQEIDAAITKLTKEHEQKIELFKKRMRGYMPHKRYGSLAVRVVRNTDKGPKIVHLESFERSIRKSASKRRWESVKFWKSIAEENEVVSAINLHEFANEYYDDLPSSARFETVLEEVRKMQERMSEQGAQPADIASATNELLTKRRMVRGFSRHFVERQDIPGYSQDADRVLADYFNGYAGYKTKFEAATKMYEALAKIHPAKQAKLYSYASKYVDYQLKQKGPEWHQVKAFMFYWYLGGNMKSAVVNATQNLITAAPLLTAYSGKGGYRQMISAMGDKAKGRLTRDEKAALVLMRSEGVTRDLMTSELMGRPDNYFQRHLVPGALEKLKWAFSTVEIFNRETTALAFYRAARSKGLSHEQAIADATSSVRDSHFSYGKADRPNAGRGRKGVLLTFRLFSINYMQFLKNLAKEGQYKAFVQSTGTLLALSGLRGVVMFETFAGVYGWLSGDDLEERLRHYTSRIASGVLGEKHPEVNRMVERMVTRGVTAGLLGADLSGSLGAGDILPEPTIESLLGPMGGMAMKAWTAKRDIMAGDYGRAMEGLSPEFIRNPLAAIRLMRDGMYTHGGTPITGADGRVVKIGGWAAAMKVFGFQPIQLTERWKVGDAVKKKELYVAQLRKTYTDAVMVKINQKDYAGVEEILKDVAEYNKGKAYDEIITITPSALKSRMSPPTGKGAAMKREVEKTFVRD